MEEPSRHSSSKIFYPAFGFTHVSGVSANDDTTVWTMRKAGGLFDASFEIEHVCCEVGMETVCQDNKVYVLMVRFNRWRCPEILGCFFFYSEARRGCYEVVSMGCFTCEFTCVAEGNYIRCWRIRKDGLRGNFDNPCSSIFNQTPGKETFYRLAILSRKKS